MLAHTQFELFTENIDSAIKQIVTRAINAIEQEVIDRMKQFAILLAGGVCFL